MAVAYRAPLCLSCASPMAKDPIAPVSPFREEGLIQRVRNPSALSAISMTKRRRRRRPSAISGKIFCLFYDARVCNQRTPSAVNGVALPKTAFWESGCFFSASSSSSSVVVPFLMDFLGSLEFVFLEYLVSWNKCESQEGDSILTRTVGRFG
ncbi:uncharacterized protein [Elaeis guineensis]|uniref:Uncharacterized protein LOC105038373 isoform X2 n=1 Tax=Elaeis guineensis var. tenera TaxID=51953 RepID=A0A6J0PDG4_ELAGV|nr:uncharacterized protein LOC105038373 isoform X2 [Elaeis guineensis]